MSYILDALRKADAEREQGRVPGLHSQLGPVPQGEAEPSPPTSGLGWPLLLAGAGGGALAVGLALWLTQAPEPAAPPPAQPVARAPVQPAAPDMPAAPPEAPPPLRPQVTPVMPPDVAVAGVPAAPPPQTATPSRTPAAAPSAPNPPAPRPAAAATASIHVDPARAHGADAIVPMEQLSDAQRRALPQLVIGGAMHSDNPGSRMLIINNGVFREGDQPAPGMVLEEIRLKAAVFRYQGQRYSVRY